jgi:hypothetical protein
MQLEGWVFLAGMKRKILFGLGFLGLVVLLAGNTHRILPEDSDPCQRDMTHKGHIDALPMFHCIGHSEYEVAPGNQGLEAIVAWDHVHPWMDREWHVAQGFSAEQAASLLRTPGK